MAIKEMQEGSLPGAEDSECGWEPMYRNINHMEITSPEAKGLGMEGFVSAGLRYADGGQEDFGAGVVLVLKTCDSPQTFSDNLAGGDNERASGWFVAMNKEEALGLAKKILELAQEMD